MHARNWFGSTLALASLTVMAAATAGAQEAYRLPPQDVVDIVDAPLPPWPSLSPNRDTLLLMHREALPPISELARPMERLAGLRLDAATNGRHGPRSVVGLSVMDLGTQEERTIALPADSGISNTTWSPDGTEVAFVMTRGDTLSLWVADLETATARELVSSGVNAVFSPISWMPDGEHLLVHLTPDSRGPLPERPRVPVGPVTQEASGVEAQVRTYQDLLTGPADAALFAWLATSQLALVDADSGDAEMIGEPGFVYSSDPSPNGEYILVGEMEQPFSYDVPWSSFPDRTFVIDLDGEEVATIARQPVADYVPIGGVIRGRRSISWQASHPARLTWAEALDGGDPRVEADQRDSVWAQAAPFTEEPVEILRTEDRYYGTQFTEVGQTGFAMEYDRDTRVIRRWLVDFADPSVEPRLAEERNYQDSYANPGSPETTRNEFGRSVVAVTDGYIYMTGEGATPEGNRPFLNRVSFDTFETEEVWRNSGENLESVIGLVEPDGSAFLTSWEDPVTPPNVRLHRGGDVIQLTDFENPHPQLNDIRRELITFEREDGVMLSSTVYLPVGYQDGDRVPVVVWAYPLEYNDAATAGQVRGSPYEFSRIAGTSPRFFLTQGYALMEDATMPIVGSDPQTVNDTFIDQLVMSAEAIVEESVRRGFGDGERVAVAGHSYGAFMTANLLAHSDIFRAGIARSGAYNRTLTPFGFQAERRTYWEAPEVYYNLSPFMHADQINEPLLLIHGEMDNNSGTYPIQSERMFAAVKGNAGTVRLVMLPYESHGYRGRESVLHTLAESFDWLDRYVMPEEDPMASDEDEEASDGAQ